MSANEAHHKILAFLIPVPCLIIFVNMLLTLVKTLNRLYAPYWEPAGVLFIKHASDKGEDWLTGSIQGS